MSSKKITVSNQIDIAGKKAVVLSDIEYFNERITINHLNITYIYYKETIYSMQKQVEIR